LIGILTLLFFFYFPFYNIQPSMPRKIVKRKYNKDGSVRRRKCSDKKSQGGCDRAGNFRSGDRAGKARCEWKPSDDENDGYCHPAWTSVQLAHFASMRKQLGPVTNKTDALIAKEYARQSALAKGKSPLPPVPVAKPLPDTPLVSLLDM
jgi:hypothetical protein